MKLCIKKIYCDSCQVLVKCREQEANSGTQILCSKCGRPLWLLDGALPGNTFGRVPQQKVQPEPELA